MDTTSDRPPIKMAPPINTRLKTDQVAREKSRVDWATGLCRVPARYAACTRNTWETTWKGHAAPWPDPVDDWMGEGDTSTLALIGEPGKGKTHVAVSILTDWARREEARWDRLHRNRSGFPDQMIMIRVPHAVRSMRRHYSSRDKGGFQIPDARGNKIDAPEFFARIAESYDLVFYDDWGSQPDRENWWTEVEGWVDDRHAAQMATIITLNPGSIGDPAARIARRITDGLVVEIPWRAA